MQTAKLRLWASVLTVLGAMGMTYLSSGALAASAASAPFHVSQILQGSSLHHAYTSSGSASSKTETLSDPDDISRWGNDFFVGFQNGVGPQGQASTDWQSR